MNKKAAIGLSINTLVVVIISLVILGGGITLLYKFIGGAEDIKAGLDTRTSQELERLLLDQGKQVALPLHVATVERGDSHVYGIGILNIGPESSFRIDVELSKVIDLNENDITDRVNSVEDWLLYDVVPISIKENQHRKEGILVNVPNEALVGQYIFSVRVFEGDIQYGNTQKFVVNVK